MQEMYSETNLRIMRGMYERRGVRFKRESDLEEKPLSRSVIASHRDPDGDVWVAVGPREEFNPAEIDLIEQLLTWTAKPEPEDRTDYREGDSVQCGTCGQTLKVKYHDPGRIALATSDALKGVALRCQTCGFIVCDPCSMPPGGIGIPTCPSCKAQTKGPYYFIDSSPDMQTVRAAPKPISPPVSTRLMEAVEDPGIIRGMAIASLVLSLSALPATIAGCGVLFPPIAILLGSVAYVRAGKMDIPRNTRLMALAGALLGGLYFLVLLIILVVAKSK